MDSTAFFLDKTGSFVRIMFATCGRGAVLLRSRQRGGLMRWSGKVALWACCGSVAMALAPVVLAADADTLVGIHQWGLQDGTQDYTRSIDPTPAAMLDSRNRGAWDVEVVNTHGDPWQQAGFFVPLFLDLYTNKNVSLVTPAEHKYGNTRTAPPTS